MLGGWLRGRVRVVVRSDPRDGASLRDFLLRTMQRGYNAMVKADVHVGVDEFLELLDVAMGGKMIDR